MLSEKVLPNREQSRGEMIDYARNRRRRLFLRESRVILLKLDVNLVKRWIVEGRRSIQVIVEEVRRVGRRCGRHQ
jgi:hypothetical protein